MLTTIVRCAGKLQLTNHLGRKYNPEASPYYKAADGLEKFCRGLFAR
jgi:hypothetical protein